MTFQSAEAASFWRYISSSLDRLVALVSESPPEVAAWRPAAAGANSIGALAAHTLGNAEENLLKVLRGEPVNRQRTAEFNRSRDPAGIARDWVVLRPALEAGIAGVTGGDLDARVDHPRRGAITRRDVLIVVARHAAEHLGQAELTRDLAAQDLAKT